MANTPNGRSLSAVWLDDNYIKWTCEHLIKDKEIWF